MFFTFKNMIQGNWLLLNGPPSDWPFLGWVSTILVGVFISALVTAAISVPAMVLGSNTTRRWHANPPLPLIALREKDGFQGSFFLGSGMVRDQQYYFWYRRMPDGTIEGGKTLRGPGVRIHELTDGSQPRMVEFAYDEPSDLYKFFLIDLREDESLLPDFYIPKGSIQEGYSL